jgi:peptide/nickel transport system permease protein
MTRYVLSRLAQSFVLLWVVTVVTFLLVQQAPGGPAVLADPSMSREAAEAYSRSLGLGQPVHEQYIEWMSALLSGNLGVSFNHSVPVTQLLLERLPNTLILGLAAFVVALIVGLPLGILSAVKKNTWLDSVGTVITLFNLSIPAFFFGIILIVIFSVTLGWLPSGNMHSVGEDGLYDLASHLILPAIVASGFMMARIARYVRSSMLEVLNEDYVRTARAKGLREWRVLTFHALRNALLPLVTVIGLTLPQLLAGAAITETVFAWPGLGQLGVEAAANADIPLIMGITLIVACMVVLANLLTDISYGLIDPRVRLA